MVHDDEEFLNPVNFVPIVEDEFKASEIVELSLAETVEILVEHFEEMSEEQVDNTIVNKDDIFEYIKQEDQNISRVFGNIDFESNRNTQDSEDSDQENTSVEDGQYYEEGNLDEMFSKLDIEEGEIEKNATLVFSSLKEVVESCYIKDIRIQKIEVKLEKIVNGDAIFPLKC
jgi:hypothetical protein